MENKNSYDVLKEVIAKIERADMFGSLTEELTHKILCTIEDFVVEGRSFGLLGTAEGGDLRERLGRIVDSID